VDGRRDHDSAKLNELATDMVVIEASNRTSPVRLLVDENVGGNWQIFVQPLKGSARCVGVAVFVDPNEFGAQPLSGSTPTISRPSVRITRYRHISTK
jgi:hypothetical protein